MVALAVAAAGVAPVKNAGNQSGGRGSCQDPQGAGIPSAVRGVGDGGWGQAVAGGRTRLSPKSMNRTCSCRGRLTPSDRRLDAWICRTRAWHTSGALKAVAGGGGTLSMVEARAAPHFPEGLGWGLTGVEVHIHDGSDGVAGPQVPQADTSKVLLKVRVPEEIIQLRVESELGLREAAQAGLLGPPPAPTALLWVCPGKKASGWVGLPPWPRPHTYRALDAPGRLPKQLGLGVGHLRRVEQLLPLDPLELQHTLEHLGGCGGGSSEVLPGTCLASGPAVGTGPSSEPRGVQGGWRLVRWS